MHGLPALRPSTPPGARRRTAVDAALPAPAGAHRRAPAGLETTGPAPPRAAAATHPPNPSELPDAGPRHDHTPLVGLAGTLARNGAEVSNWDASDFLEARV